MNVQQTKNLMKYLTNTNINSKETSELVHVKTAQFWFGYIKMLHFYRKFTWSIVLGHLYIYCLPQKLITCSPSTIQITPDHWYKFTFWSSVKHMRMFMMNSLKTVLYQKNWKRFFKTSSWFNIGRNSYCSSYEPKKVKFHFYQFKIGILSEWRSFPKFLLSLIWKQIMFPKNLNPTE